LGLLLVAATLIAAAPLVDGAHHVATRHFYCAEHHELAHVCSGVRHRHLGSDGPAVASGGATRSDLVGHEHCSLQPIARHDTQLTPAVAVTTTTRQLEVEPVAAPDAMRPLAILVEAPKQSPPAALS
jgi:hypothetical protein